MSIKKRGLGRGLDALLGGSAPEAAGNIPDGEPRSGNLKNVAIQLLRPSRFQPRKAIDPERLRELADSISAQGVVQPVVVRSTGEQGYEIIAGERRWRAAQLAGLSEIPVVIRQANDQTALAIALIENLQREDLNPMEQAEGLKRLLDEFGMTHQQLGDAVGKSRATVTNLLRLNELHPEVKDLLVNGRLEMGHARALLGLPFDDQVDLARQVADKQLSVRATEVLVQNQKEGVPPKPAPTPPKDPDIRSLENNLSSRIGAPVLIKHGKQGAGQLIIRYDSLDQLEGVLERIR